jgi:Pentapeptide repeats (8 copies)
MAWGNTNDGSTVDRVVPTVPLTRRQHTWSANRIGVVFVVAGMAVLILGYNYPSHWWLNGFVAAVYPNSGADLIGASIVILLVDRFARQREDEERRRQLVRECGSIDHAVANRALLELEARQWLSDGALAEAELAGANLSRARLEAADLSGANLVGANLEGANLCRATLNGAGLGGAQLSRAVLEWALLTGARMSGADLRRVDASGARLDRADLTYVDLSGADLTRADLTGADLREANLSGADMTGATLTSVNLLATTYDQSTSWPDGFLPPETARLVSDITRAG